MAKEKKVKAAWLPIDLLTPDKPEMETIIDALDCSKNEAVGAFLRLLCWANANCEEDGCTGLSPKALDRKLELAGFAEALIACGWASLGEDGKVTMFNFANKNSNGARQRLQTAKRNAKKRHLDAQKEEQEDVYQPFFDVYNTLPASQDVQEVKNSDDTSVRDASRESNACAALASPKETLTYKNTESSTTTVNKGQQLDAWRNDAFAEWCGKLCACHPAAARYQVLPKPVEQAAREAFSLVQVSDEDCKMLKAYFKAEIPESRGVDKYYRPASLEKFFADLGDVLSHATNWAKWSGYSRKRKAKAKPVHPLPLSQDEGCSPEDAKALFDQTRKDLNLPQ